MTVASYNFLRNDQLPIRLKNLKVALFISNIGDINLKGPQKVGITLAKELSKRAIKTLIVTNSPNCTVPKIEKTCSNLHVFIVPGDANSTSYLRNFSPILRKLKEFKPHIIHGHGVASTILVAYLGKILRVPTIQTIYDVLLNSCILNAIQINALFFVDQVICASNFIKRYLISRKIPAKKMVILPYGIEDVWFKPNQTFTSTLNPKNEIVLFWGDANHDRGIDTLLKAIPKVLEFFPKVNFVFAIRNYDTIYRKILRDFMRTYPITLDLPKYHHICEIVSSATIIVLPYNVTTMQPPLTLVESLLLGKPVITTDVEANRELIGKNVRGLLIRRNDSDQLAEAIIYLLSNDEKRAELAIKAHEFIFRRYQWDRVMERILRVYRDALMKNIKTKCSRIIS